MAGSNTEGRTTIEVGADGVALITITNPPLNFLNFEVMNSLKESYAEALRRDDVQAIVLTGANNQLSGGFDISALMEIQEGRSKGEPRPGYLAVEFITDTLEAAKKPTVVAIEGLARGGGLEISMACHARISTPAAELSLPELSVGAITGFGGTQRLPRLVGVAKSLEMLLTSKPVQGTEAYELGLVDAVVPPDELLSTARQWAVDIAARTKPMVRSLYKTEKVEPLEEARGKLKQARDEVLKQTPDLKHHIACINVIEEGIVSGPNAGLWKETDVFQELLVSDTCKSLVRTILAHGAPN